MTLLETVAAYRFGRFVLEPDRRVLRLEETEVGLGARAFDILLILVRQRDRVVTKDEILATVWNGRFVEENNLAVHVSALRRALGEKAGGERFIATVSGVGYRFVGTVEESGPRVDAPDPDPHRLSAPRDIVDLSPPPRQGAEPGESEAPPEKRRLPGWLAVAVGVLGVLAVLLWLGLRHPGAEGGAMPALSIAVVPFRDLDGGHASLADAVTDDLTADLSFVPGSVVVARDSTELFRETAVSADEIGRALKVRYLIEGSLLADGSRLHVDTELVEARTGRQLWTSIFDVDKTDIEDRLRETVEHLSSVLRVTLIETVALTTRARADPDATDLLWQARSVLDRRSDFGAYLDAERLLERAAAIAPQDANVLAELGRVLIHKMGDFNDPDEAADYNRAVSVTDQAFKSQPDDALASTSAGLLDWVDYRYREAQAHFRTALSIDPDNLDAREGLALCARQLGQFDEMIAQLRAITLIDPIGPRSPPRDVWMGMGYLMLGKPRMALDWLHRAAVAGDGLAAGGSELGWQDWRQFFAIAALQMTGDHDGAKALLAELARIRPHLSVFQLSHYASRPVATMSGYLAYLDALRSAGMPLYPPEDEDDHVSPTSQLSEHSDFDPTPVTLPGGSVVTAATVHTLLASRMKPIVVDVSVGATVIPGALWLSPDDQARGLGAVLQARSPPLSPDQTIITMSYSPFGWQGYNAALFLVQHGFHHVLWYRGGEAAWAKAGFPLEDRRAL